MPIGDFVIMRLYLPCLGLFLILIPSKPLYSFFIRFFD
jgi:hypothetical protein